MLVIKLFEFVLKMAGAKSEENAIFLFLCLFDVCIMVVQLKIIDLIWTRKKYVREFEVTIMMLVIFFSPLQISSIPAQNAGIVKDLLNYICIYTFLLPSTQ